MRSRVATRLQCPGSELQTNINTNMLISRSNGNRSILLAIPILIYPILGVVNHPSYGFDRSKTLRSRVPRRELGRIVWHLVWKTYIHSVSSLTLPRVSNPPIVYCFLAVVPFSQATIFTNQVYVSLLCIFGLFTSPLSCILYGMHDTRALSRDFIFVLAWATQAIRAKSLHPVVGWDPWRLFLSFFSFSFSFFFFLSGRHGKKIETREGLRGQGN
ncbi:hypothetical protein VTK26DRAFT_2622 [Humicola hyalothermophila]